MWDLDLQKLLSDWTETFFILKIAILLQIKNMFGFFISDDPVVRNFNHQQGVKFWNRQFHCEIFK